MSGIPLGTYNEVLVAVTDENAISFLGSADARVLATPWLIAYLEWASRDAVKPYLLDGEDTVGTQVNVRHLAATPLGWKARFRSEVVDVNHRRVLFRVEAWDDKEKIGEGTHERAIINVERFAARLRAKTS